MDYSIYAALALFAFTSSVTPGPNNLMLMASGANFGFRRSIPHLLGVGIGFGVMVIAVGVGLMGVFAAYPVVHQVLKGLSVAYLMFLAWRIAGARAPNDSRAAVRPMTFVQAALFQWVNPKSWMMALTALTAYAPTQGLDAVLLVALTFLLINLPSISSWAALGQQLQCYLSEERWLVLFNRCMAILLLATLYPVLFPESLTG